MILSACANQVLQEFGGVMPEDILSFEDAEREFLNVRALELQRLGIAGTEKLATFQALAPTTRTGILPSGFGQITPDFVELVPSYDSSGLTKLKVEIVPIEDIANYEGSHTIAFYGTPMQYSLSFNAWETGAVNVWYSLIEDLSVATSVGTVTFPAAFWTFLFKKTAFNLVKIAILKLAFKRSMSPASKMLYEALQGFKRDLTMQTSEWEREFRKYMNLDLNTQPHTRMSIEERWGRGLGNVNDLLG